jgi:hypothetical protein
MARRDPTGSIGELTWRYRSGEAESEEREKQFRVLPNGLAVQLRSTALTANAGAQRPPPERYHGSIGTSC